MSTHPDPDIKDWTWTLERRCPECGLEAATYEIADVADRLEFAAVEWVQILTANPAAGSRPEPAVWSPLEYGAHVRDVFVRFDARLEQMLTADDPTFDNWDQDQAALEGDYANLDPDLVAEELAVAAAHLVSRLRDVGADAERRTGARSDGSTFTVRTLAQYLLHDVDHHLWDVTGQPAPSSVAG
ncbi:MAG: DinB family protein [Propionibacteriaceae bacterium]